MTSPQNEQNSTVLLIPNLTTIQKKSKTKNNAQTHIKCQQERNRSTGRRVKIQKFIIALTAVNVNRNYSHM